ncbi:MAG: PAS domain S-box protein, partial [Leptolyngbyaceae bacterium]|nr:PAS domain S-box protein [Leptolyngbyaceae bacterium]
MSPIPDLETQLVAAQARLQALTHRANDPHPEAALLPEALVELSNSLEELAIAIEEQRCQTEALYRSRNELEQERQRYQRLFDFAPDAHLVTDANGNLLMANQSAATLLNLRDRYAVGKPLVIFIERDSHPLFYQCLDQIQQTLTTMSQTIAGASMPLLLQDRWFQIKPRNGDPFPASLALSGERLASGEYRLHWAFRDMRDRARLEAERAQAERDRAAAQAALERQNGVLEELVRDRTAALAAAEARLRLLLDTSPATTYSCQPDGDFACNYISQNVEALLGYTAAEFCANPSFWLQHLHPDDADGILAALPQLFEQGQLKYEYQMRHRDGHYIWIRDELTLLRDGAGNPVEIVGYIVDISEQKATELAQQSSRDRLEAMISALPDLIFRVNRAGQYLDFPQSEFTPNILQREDLVGLTFTEGLPPELAQAHQHRIDQALNHRTVHVSEQQVEINGKPQYEEVRVAPCGQDEVVFIIRNITERKAAELERQHLTNRLTLALQAGAIGVWEWNVDTDELVWDQRLYDIYGLQTLGQSTPYQDWRDRVHTDDIDQVEAQLQALLRGEAEFDLEFRIWRTDGELRWIQAIALIQGNGSILGINRDITADKQAALNLRTYALEVEDLYNNAPCGYCTLDTDCRITQINNTALQWLNAERQVVLGQPFSQFIPATSRPLFEEHQSLLIQAGQVKKFTDEISLLGLDGGTITVLINQTVQQDAEGNVTGSRITLTDIRQRLKAETLVKQQLTQENLLRQMSDRIRQSLDLATIFDTACNEVRQALEADRVAIFQFYPDANYNDGEFIAESMAGDYPSVVETRVHDHCFGENFAKLYAQGRYYAVADIESGELTDCHEDILQQFQVRANLVMPLVLGESNLWGLLCVHQCRQPRPWQTAEIDLTQQIASQLAIAINQASLYQRLQAELTVRQQAEARIQRQLEQQRSLAALTETVRQSLAINDILATATQRVKDLLQCDRVIIFRLYADGRSRIVEEAVSPEFPAVKDMHWEDEVWSDDILERYWQGHPRIIPDVMDDIWTDCLVEYSQAGQIQSKMVAPILQEAYAWEQSRWVDPVDHNQLWGVVVAHACGEKRVWQDPEAELLQQIANSMAIAIQQANLFEKVQVELGERQQAEQQLEERNQQLLLSNEELARATRLKDEFLANMSHELRTPLNAIMGMTEALQAEVYGIVNTKQLEVLGIVESSATHLLSLINDILDVAKIESGTITLERDYVAIQQLCISSLSFIKQQALNKRIQLHTQIPPLLPDLWVDA